MYRSWDAAAEPSLELDLRTADPPLTGLAPQAGKLDL